MNILFPFRSERFGSFFLGSLAAMALVKIYQGQKNPWECCFPEKNPAEKGKKKSIFSGFFSQITFFANFFCRIGQSILHLVGTENLSSKFLLYDPKIKKKYNFCQIGLSGPIPPRQNIIFRKIFFHYKEKAYKMSYIERFFRFLLSDEKKISNKKIQKNIFFCKTPKNFF